MKVKLFVLTLPILIALGWDYYLLKVIYIDKMYTGKILNAWIINKMHASIKSESLNLLGQNACQGNQHFSKDMLGMSSFIYCFWYKFPLQV